jgi:uncharacterized protein YbgA (DUF1722 family)/uncharacterized protein YbbK (DUF523 family)
VGEFRCRVEFFHFSVESIEKNMRTFPRPKVIVSKCLEFASCRWNGLMISSEVVRKLKPHVEFQPVCPEVEIGLGIPRDPIRIVEQAGVKRLVQPATDRDVSREMSGFGDSLLDSLTTVDGFILKDRSPSCGIANVKVFPSKEKSAPLGKGAGFFGGKVLERFSVLPVEDEGRLTNFRIREHFLTKLYVVASFQALKAKGRMKDLVQFQAENKYLLMAYNQKEMRALGRIVANLEKLSFGEVMRKYEEHLHRAFARAPRYNSNINVLMHGMGYFSKELSSKEKAFFLDQLEQYRIGKVPLSVPVGLLRSWIIRFENAYLAQQTFFEPYPLDLVEISDSGKGRKLSG